MLTISQIKTLFPRATPEHVAAFLEQHDRLFEESEFSKKPFRLEFFLSQIGHESNGLSVEREGMTYTAKRMTEVWPSRFKTIADAEPYAGQPEKLGNFVYAKRNGNGDAASGDGYRYRGRGYVQLTGRDGYGGVGKLVKLDLVAKPDLVFAPDHALKVALGFWKWKGANTVCDTGDFAAVTKAVNGGLIGMADRLAWLDKVRRTMADPPPKKAQPDAATVTAVQKALRALGYTDIGAADGQIGQRTIVAIGDYRTKNKLGDGLVDAKLLKSLGIGPV